MTDVSINFEGENLGSPWLPVEGSAPAVLIFPTVMGVSDLEKEFGGRLNALGYHAMVADPFGTVTRDKEPQAMLGEMDRLKSDRVALRRRLLALFQAMLDQPGVNAGKVAVIGYCFGGMCALDLARTGAALAAAASFHGILEAPAIEPQPIDTRIVAYHGWDDPYVLPEAVPALAKELTEAGADWQIHGYGQVGHGFTNPNAGRAGIAGLKYNALAAKRSWASLELLLAEAFA